MADFQAPRSAYDTVDEMVYFARMLDKARLHAAGRLHPDYHDSLGGKMDRRCCRFLRVEYPALRERVLAGAGDEAIFAWCCEAGRRPDEDDRALWNGFMTKRGWRDEASENLAAMKRAAGLGDRADLETFFDFFEVDEGRRPR